MTEYNGCLTPEEVQVLAGELRKILTHDSLEKLIASEAAWKKVCDLQEQLLESYKSMSSSRDAVIEDLKAEVEYQKQGVKLLENVVEIDSKALAQREKSLVAFEQWALHSQVIEQTSTYYAIESKSILMYILERTARGDDFIRLWEVLPQDQKDIYKDEARKWLAQQPRHEDPELRKKLLPPPNQKIEYTKGDPQ